MIVFCVFCFCFSSLAFSQAFSVSRFFALYSAYWKHFSNDDEVRDGCKLLSQGSITNKQQFAGMEAELDWTNLCKFQDRRCTGTKAKKAPRWGWYRGIFSALVNNTSFSMYGAGLEQLTVINLTFRGDQSRLPKRKKSPGWGWLRGTFSALANNLSDSEPSRCIGFNKNWFWKSLKFLNLCKMYLATGKLKCILLHFWAISCPSCFLEHFQLQPTRFHGPGLWNRVGR